MSSPELQAGDTARVVLPLAVTPAYVLILSIYSFPFPAGDL